MYYHIIKCLENGWLLIGASTDNLIYGVVWNACATAATCIHTKRCWYICGNVSYNS